MSVTRGGIPFLLAVIGFASCNTAPQMDCKSTSGKTLAAECCGPGGGLREELFQYSQCSLNTAPPGVSELITKCGLQGIPGGGIVDGAAGGFGQGLAAIASTMDLARTYVSEKEGVSTDAASDGGTFIPTGNVGSGAGGSAGGIAVPSSTPGSGSGSSTGGSMLGGSPGGSGGAKTAAASLTDPNAQLGLQLDTSGSDYASSGGAAGGRARGGAGGGGNALSGMIQSLMGGMPGAGGKDGAGGANGVQRFGTAGNGPGGAAGTNVLSSGQDPEDYFTRIAPDASLFRIVEKRYEQTSLKGQLR